MPFFKRFLIPTDFSESSLAIYEYVSWLAEKNNAKVDLIHVIPQISYLNISEEVMGNPFKVQEKYDQWVEKLYEKLNAELNKNISQSCRGEVFVSDNVRVAQGIIDQSQKKDYDLIIIGSRGRANGIFKRGSLSLRLIRQSKIPVLSFNRKPEEGAHKILMPTDGSKNSFAALETALKMAEQLNSSVILYSVLEFDFAKISLMGGDPSLSEMAAQGQKNEILRNFKESIEELEEYEFEIKLGVDGAEVRPKTGRMISVEIIMEQNISSHNSIVEFANENADLVVMTTHGRSGLSKILLGSVAEKVVRHLEIPALTIKPDSVK